MKLNTKFTTTFSSEIKPLVSEDKDEFLSLAALEQIGEFIPDVDTGKNIDLLPVAFNACVVNRVNKNDDVVDTQAALAMYEYFANKPINIEHDRKKVIGVILTAGFSEFGTDKPLKKEQIENTKDPFNITLGGILWRVVNDNVTDLVEEASDPTSEFYKKISASWELGFSDYQIAILEKGKKNIAEAEYLSDVEQIKDIKSCLRGFGGSGELEDGKCAYRQIVGNIVPLGIGLTESPAAEVEGVLTEQYKKKNSEENLTLDSSEDEAHKEQVEKELNNPKTSKTISHLKENDVIQNKDCLMEIKNMNDITDENLKQVSASAVSDFIEEELKKASEQFNTEKQEFSSKLEESEQKSASLAEDMNTMKGEFENVQKELEVLKAEKSEREATDKFNERMSLLDEKYELTDGEREVIASDIKDMDDETFETHLNKLSVLLDHKSREALAAAEVEKATQRKAEEKKAEEAIASQSDNFNAEEMIEKAMDQAEAETEEIPVSTAAEDETLADRYKKAFSIDKFDINL